VRTNQHGISGSDRVQHNGNTSGGCLRPEVQAHKHDMVQSQLHGGHPGSHGVYIAVGVRDNTTAI
jgi:hypothetical protein